MYASLHRLAPARRAGSAVRGPGLQIIGPVDRLETSLGASGRAGVLPVPAPDREQASNAANVTLPQDNLLQTLKSWRRG